MEHKVETGFKLRTSYSDNIINYRLSQKLKLLGNSEFNHLTIILTPTTRKLSENSQHKLTRNPKTPKGALTLTH